jgi:hypothetical protein
MIIVDGYKFYDTKQEYLVGSVGDNEIKRLHIYIWEKHNGKVPKGYCVHHKDHNKLNNDISNLEIIERSEHQSYHGKLRDKAELIEAMNKARIYASIWHGSEEGVEWHKHHYEQMKHKFHKRFEKVCIYCGDSFDGDHKSKFCSNKCKSAHRRKIGVDNITTSCIKCGELRTLNKYDKSKSCKSCAHKDTKSVEV